MCCILQWNVFCNSKTARNTVMNVYLVAASVKMTSQLQLLDVCIQSKPLKSTFRLLFYARHRLGNTPLIKTGHVKTFHSL